MLAHLVASATRMLQPAGGSAAQGGGGGAEGGGSPAQAAGGKGGSKTYHPILGWVRGGVADVAAAGAQPGEEVFANQQAQLRPLWRGATLRRLFCLPAAAAAAPPQRRAPSPHQLHAVAAPVGFEPAPEEPASSKGGGGGLFSRKQVGVGGGTGGAAGGSAAGAAAATAERATVLQSCTLFNQLHVAMPVLQLEV